MAASCSVPGLDEALRNAGCERHVAAAADWCERMGARDIDEIAEEDVFQEFVEHLKLKPLEIKRLRRGLQGGDAVSSPQPASQGTCSAGYAGATGAAAPTAAPTLPPTSHSVFVKNTFLDLDDGLRTPVASLPRSSTVPAPTSISAQADEEEEQHDDEDLPPTPAAVDAPGLYKTLTLDGYEPVSDWEWIHGQQLPPLPAAASMPLPEVTYCPNCGNGSSPDSKFCRHCGQKLTEDQEPQMTGMQDQGQVGMVMIPAEAVQPAYAMPVPSGMCFPGCMAVPMERFGRFPGIMEQMPGTAAIAEPLEASSTDESKRAMVLSRAFSVASNIYRIRWTVDARKLKSTDREAVSPKFDLSFAGPVTFNMILRPRTVAQERGGASFRRSRGRGTVHVRCMAESDATAKPLVTFRLGVGSEKAGRQLKIRGPVRHDFSEKNICGLPDGQDEWDFGKAVNDETQTFVICLEVLSGNAED